MKIFVLLFTLFVFASCAGSSKGKVESSDVNSFIKDKQRELDIQESESKDGVNGALKYTSGVIYLMVP
jgi:hypothetical protein